MKRVRLLIDVMLSDEEVEWLQPMIEKQPLITIGISTPTIDKAFIGRFVGAQEADRLT